MSAIPLSERARSRGPREARKPAYLAFAKIDKGWVKIGAAWNARSGENVLSVQIDTIPLNWSGRLILAVPSENGEPNVGGDDYGQ